MSEFNIGSVALRDIDLNYSNDFVVNVPDDYVNQSGFSTVTLALDSTDLVKRICHLGYWRGQRTGNV